MTDALPTNVIWHLTYACQLRCTHCYTESGRRAARTLPRDVLLRIADVLVGMRLEHVSLAGGEPLLVPAALDVADRLAAGGVATSLFTNGLLITEDNAAEIGRRFTQVHVSLDGTTAAVHDAVRGRSGAFDETMRALAALDRAARDRREAGAPRLRFGLEVVLVRSNLAQLDEFCTVIAPQFPELSFVALAAAAPLGLASRPSYLEHELLREHELELLRDPSLRVRLRALLPDTIDRFGISDGFFLQLGPSQDTPADRMLELEADGGVRGMVPYEGVVGNILADPPEHLWQRVLARRRDPVVVRELDGVTTMRDWARAVRRLDRHFGSTDDLVRIARRPVYSRGFAQLR